MTPERPKTDASTPDLDSLDADWGEDAGEEATEGAAGVAAASDDAPAEDDSLDDVDEGWETVPDPKGGPPQRRRVSPKERARRKREKQRAKADLAAKKQKAKTRTNPGLRRSEPAEDEIASGNVASDVPSPKPSRPKDVGGKSTRKSGKNAASARASKKGLSSTMLAVIVLAAAGGAAALYYMMTSH